MGDGMKSALLAIILTLTLAALIGCGPVTGASQSQPAAYFAPGSIVVTLYATFPVQIGSTTQPAVKVDSGAIVLTVDPSVTVNATHLIGETRPVVREFLTTNTRPTTETSK
jgi:hypothetical protein